MNIVIPVMGLLLVAVPAVAQQSPSYEISDHAFNAGGHPEGGTVPASASFRITLDAIGDPVVGPGLASAAFHMDGSFGSCYPPPGEVHGVRFADADTLDWVPEKSVGSYNLYRDLMSNLSGLGYGQCERQNLPDEAVTDSDAVPAGDGYFYLVTAENRLQEEGTKGKDSSGVLRQGSACP